MHKMIAVAAVLFGFALASPAASAAGTGRYCLVGPGQQMNCNFATIDACNDNKQDTQSCVARASTTGMGGSMSKSKKSKSK